MPIEVLMPALSPTMEKGNLAKWLKREGDPVKSGDVIAEIETDKATMEVEAVDEGTIGKLFVAEGTEGVKVNTPIAALLAEGESASDIKAEAPAEAATPTEQADMEAPGAGPVAPASPSAPAAPKLEAAADPDVPAGTEMVEMTVRQALNEAMAEEMRQLEQRILADPRNNR
jgi:pyruvate dehydrogenase E1 component beta subunit